MEDPRVIADYHVDQKILLRKGNLYLVLSTPKGRFDIPGGRIDTVEDDLPLREILDREIVEELGANFRYKIGDILFQYRRWFNDPEGIVRIFITIFDAEYVDGEIQLSDEHTEYSWLTAAQILANPELFISTEEYEAFKNYFAQNN